MTSKERKEKQSLWFKWGIMPLFWWIQSEDMTQARLVYTVNATSPGKEKKMK